MGRLLESELAREQMPVMGESLVTLGQAREAVKTVLWTQGPKTIVPQPLTVVQQGIWYFISTALDFLAALVAMVAFTRLFTREEYGTWNLTLTTLALLTVVANGGLSQAAVRFYWREADGEGGRPGILYSTLLLAALTLGLVGMALGGTIGLVGRGWPRVSNLAHVLVVAAPLVLTSNLVEIFQGLYRARQEGRAFGIVTLTRRFGTLAVGLVLVSAFHQGVQGYFWGQMAVEAILVAFLLMQMGGAGAVFRSGVSLELLMEFLRYGLPLVITLLALNVLSFGDRYVIQFFLGEGEVGLYAVGYTAAAAVMGLLCRPMNLLVPPLYVACWEREGSQATREMLRRACEVYLMLGLPLFFGLMALGRPVLLALASERFADSAIVLPWAGAGLLLNGLTTMTQASLIIHNRTGLILIAYLVSVTLNLGMNVILVPQIGILGAAVGTTLSYAAHLALVTGCAFRSLEFPLLSAATFRYLLASIVMALVLKSLGGASGLVALLLLVGLGVVTYNFLVGVMDRQFRDKMQWLLRAMRQIDPKA